jgi:hypothetical protein
VIDFAWKNTVDFVHAESTTKDSRTAAYRRGRPLLWGSRIDPWIKGERHRNRGWN